MKLLCTHSYYARHCKEPKSKLDVKFNKEAWDKLKYEHDTTQPHFKLDGESLFNPDTGTLEIKIDKEEADKLANILALTDEEIQEKTRASKNAAEIFCHTTNGTYTEFNKYAAEFGMYPPRVGEPAIRTLKHIAKLSDISINVPLLVYAVYEKMYKNNKFPYTYGDIIYDIVDSMVTLKEEGMIQ